MKQKDAAKRIATRDGRYSYNETIFGIHKKYF